MQKSNKHILLITMLIVTYWISSCKKLVDAGEPVATITTTSVFTTDAQANSTLAAIYSRMMTNTGKLAFSNGATTIYAGLSSDELVNFSGTVSANDFQFVNNNLQSNNPNVLNYFWQPAYKCIYDANAAIMGMAASASGLLSDSAKKELTGEAKFIRAFCYFYLVNLFGDVPLALTTDFNQTALMGRTSKADVYNQIVQDLQDAQSLLVADYSMGGGERIRPNKWAATALLARVRLYQNDWVNAEKEATAVIENSQYGLVASLTNVFDKNSMEAIWQLQQNSNVSASPLSATWDGRNFIPTYRFYTLDPGLQALFLSNYSLFSALITPPFFLSPQQANAFESGDKRKERWLDSIPNPNGPVYFHPFKYTLQQGVLAAPVPQYYMVLRLGEQYLIRAEARAQLDKSGADADINAIRSRAGLPATTATSKEELLAAVAQERRVELFAEWGHRWFDLKRTGKAVEALAAAGKMISENMLLYPIPISEIIADPNLTQNNGY